MALLGDYRQLAMECSLEDASALLPYEVASLYVRPQAHDTVVMTSRHPQRTQTLAQGEAVVQFLCQTLDMVCYGGYFHEPSLPWP